MHDTDGNNKLDGCELVKSLIHWHGKNHNGTYLLCFHKLPESVLWKQLTSVDISCHSFAEMANSARQCCGSVFIFTDPDPSQYYDPIYWI